MRNLFKKGRSFPFVPDLSGASPVHLTPFVIPEFHSMPRLSEPYLTSPFRPPVLMHTHTRFRSAQHTHTPHPLHLTILTMQFAEQKAGSEDITAFTPTAEEWAELR